MVGEQTVDARLSQSCDELVGDLLQRQHADAALADASMISAALARPYRQFSVITEKREEACLVQLP